MPRGQNHKHLCSRGPNHGTQAWIMLVETSDGQFVLEDMFGEWSGAPNVIEAGAWPPHEHLFETKHDALAYAAQIITERFRTDIAEWLEAAGINTPQATPQEDP